jgi:hypothetical protein
VAVDSLVGAEDSALGSPYGTVFGVYRAAADTDKDDTLLDRYEPYLTPFLKRSMIVSYLDLCNPTLTLQTLFIR